jgi:hypothetical protein
MSRPLKGLRVLRQETLERLLVNFAQGKFVKFYYRLRRVRKAGQKLTFSGQHSWLVFGVQGSNIGTRLGILHGVFSRIPQTFHICRKKKTPWSESASELYRLSGRRLSAKWLSPLADRRCHVVSVTDPYGRILGFLDRSRYFSIK